MKWVKTRWLLAAGCLYLSVKLMFTGLSQNGHQDTLNAIPPLLFSMALYILTVILVAPETAFRVAEWCSRPFANILFPSDEFSKPPLNYRLARRYRDEMRWEDAARQYRKIIRHYPKEMAAYLELLEVADHMRDHGMRKKYAALYRRQFPQEVTQGEQQSG